MDTRTLRSTGLHAGRLYQSYSMTQTSLEGMYRHTPQAY